MEDKLKESQPGWKEVKKHISQVTKARWQDRLDRDKNKKQSYGLCERGRGWEDLGEWH